MTFYFFDLETSGFNPREDRIMQFGGQRTDANLKPIGKPDNILVKISSDILPSPDAVMVTGITPQQTLAEGITEAEFCKYFINELATEGTVFVGYNNLRFDNDFIRFTLWRNFYDAYEWSWKNKCSTWDLLDVVRMTRALRPDGINWPYSSNGKPSNKLELVASINKLNHDNAHDALSDVKALIGLAQLLKSKQPKLFEYLLSIRSKDKVAPLVTTGKPIIYTSGRYSSEFDHTTIAAMIAPHPDRPAALMYDLRTDPDQYRDVSPVELAKKWQTRSYSTLNGKSSDTDIKIEEENYFPVKVLVYNKCPAVAGDLRVLDTATQERLSLHQKIIDNHYQKLRAIKGFGDRFVEALKIISKPDQEELVIDEQNVDTSLYKGFIGNDDKTNMRVITAADKNVLADLNLDFSDKRLQLLFPLYKARNFPNLLTAQEQTKWEAYKFQKLFIGETTGRAAVYFARINEILSETKLTKNQIYLLEELKLYGQSIVPVSLG